MGFDIYDVNKYAPKQMVAVPLILLFLALGLLGFNWLSTGMPVTPGIDFAGGTAVTVMTDDSVEDIEAYFAGFPLTSVGEGLNGGKYIRFGPMSDDEYQNLVEKVNDRYSDPKIDQIGEAFGEALQQQALLALIFSFIGMAIVVFLAFRDVVPSIAVVLSALSDIAITAAIMDIVGIQLTLATTAALLMLIGYSVDSDILLTTRLLKRQGKLDEKLAGAYRTGIIMTTTTIAAIAAMFAVTAFGQVEVIAQIAAVLLIGLFVDLMNTWVLNAGILKGYLLQKNGRRA
ncbi:protein translocase subunit SecF [Methanofollis formosanus]|uniref:Protein-export membrane protein SecF n=1 Tax=Methanofollis formosanus TaxID=299308 RepID=A0A8G1A199_9EURY|nr:protein translocase subunit SecF [Methanofollis formosanus]QYZ78252.1 protein translocase subunit SecF [Methanofollis formosanus]